MTDEPETALSTLEQQVSYYISALRGTDHESAISLLATYFQQEHDASVRKALVHIASQMNSSNAIALLTEALNDVEPSVWKEALDGLVSLGGPEVLEVICQARRRAPAKAEWLDEAIDQITQDR